MKGSMDPIRESFLQGFIRLSLWYLRNAVQEGTESLEDVVNRRVDIYRNTRFFDRKTHPSTGEAGEEWTEILTRLGEIYERRKNGRHTDSKQKGWPCFGPTSCWRRMPHRNLRNGPTSAGPMICATQVL
ncbi:MAG: hypothetical protein CME25_09065 [Gemmatimonadetes bacterium]|nr:hypothetical protein [Gemmatimonadota bacterium]